MKVILASQSPRRKELLDLMGLQYEIMVSNADETFEEGLTIEEQSKRLGYIKAKTIFDKTKGNRLVIGSDTMVLKDGKAYGKPHSKEEAVRMLTELKNAKHTVITSLAVLAEKNGKYFEFVDYDKAEVYVKDMTMDEIEHWISIGNPYNKAGGYAIQSQFGVHIEKINGNYFTVVGLPIHKLYDVLKEIEKEEKEA